MRWSLGDQIARLIPFKTDDAIQGHHETTPLDSEQASHQGDVENEKKVPEISSDPSQPIPFSHALVPSPQIAPFITAVHHFSLPVILQYKRGERETEISITKRESSWFKEERLHRFYQHRALSFDDVRARMFQEARSYQDYKLVHSQGVRDLHYATLDFCFMEMDVEVFRPHVHALMDRRLQDKLDDFEKKVLGLESPPPSTICFPSEPGWSYYIRNAGQSTFSLSQVEHREFETLEKILEAVARDTDAFDDFFNKKTKVIVAYQQGTPRHRELPLAFVGELKRAAVFSKLAPDESLRVMGMEIKRTMRAAARFILLPHHDGADEQLQTVKTEFVWMSVNKSSAEVKGTVVEGQFKGRSLSSMSGDDLRALHAECSSDADSRKVCEAYFYHIRLEGWSAQPSGKEQPNGMTVESACTILGLDIPPEKTTISRKKIMTAFHTAAMAANEAGRTDMKPDEIAAQENKLRKVVDAKNRLFVEFKYDT
jgi:hypothetical protein